MWSICATFFILFSRLCGPSLGGGIRALTQFSAPVWAGAIYSCRDEYLLWCHTKDVKNGSGQYNVTVWVSLWAFDMTLLS